MKTINKIINNLKNHLVDSTAMLAESTPVFAAFETGIAGMSDEVSINARLLSIGLAYSGMSYVYTKGRDLSRKLFKIKDTTKEKIQSLHDAVYLGAFNFVFTPVIYLASGGDAEEIAIGTAGVSALGLVNGAPMGYTVDLFRDLTGLKNCERPSYPNLLKKQNSKTKKSLAVLFTAGAILLTAGIYALTPNKQGKQNVQHQQQTAQQIIQTQNLYKFSVKKEK